MNEKQIYKSVIYSVLNYFLRGKINVLHRKIRGIINIVTQSKLGVTNNK